MATPILVDEEEPLDEDEEPAFEYRDVTVRRDKWVTDEFKVADLLGRGKFGEVKRCCEISTGREFAAKFISAPRAPDKKEVEHEINIMKKLRHKRIIQLYDAYECKAEMCLILEIIYGGELFDRVISDDFILTEKACICFVRQICEGIDYMHSSSIIHLDMKPENILCLSRKGNRVKLIDFGLAREWHPKKDLRVLFGTPEFMAPEVVQYEPITFATDMWSVGVICYVLLSGLSPFMGDTDADTLQNVLEGDYDFDYPEFDDISEDAKDLVSNLLLKDKKKRLSAKQCLEHKWLQRKHEPKSPMLELSKRRLRTFVYRRKWQKIVNAIIALKRMGVQISLLRRSALSSLEPGASVLQPGVLAHMTKTPICLTNSVKPAGSKDQSKTHSAESHTKEKKGKLLATPIGKFIGRTSDKIKDITHSKGDKHRDNSGDQESMNHLLGGTTKMADTSTSSVFSNKNGSGTGDSSTATNGTADTVASVGQLPPSAGKFPDNEKSKAKTKNPKTGIFGKKKKPKDKTDESVGGTISGGKKKTEGIQRDNSLRRSTKLSKQGPKPEQYVIVEKDVPLVNRVASSGQTTSANVNDDCNDVSSDGPPSTRMNSTSENDSKLQKGAIKPGFGTFSRVRDRIKFLEQKETDANDTLRRKKGRVNAGNDRFS